MRGKYSTRIRPTLDEMKLFTLIADYLDENPNTSLRETAKSLVRPVSVIAACIGILEKKWGSPLLLRESRGHYTRLTAEGQDLCQQFTNILDAHGKVVPKPVVAVGTMNNLLVNLLPPAVNNFVRWLREHKQSWDDVQLEFWEGDYPEILTHLRRGIIDFGIAWDPPDRNCYHDVDFEELRRDIKMMCVWTEEYAFADRRKLSAKSGAAVSLKDLRRELLILPSPAFQPGLEEMLSASQSKQWQIIKAKNYETVLAFARAGIGIGVVPEYYAGRTGVNFTLIGDLPGLTVAAYTPKNRKLTGFAADLLRNIRDSLSTKNFRPKK
jgi:DNA-binding transcriptional LysR family regulator